MAATSLGTYRSDHVELLPDVLDAYEVREVWDSGAMNPICGYRAFLRAVAAEPGVRYHDALHDFGPVTASFGAKNCYGDQLSPEDIELPAGSMIDEEAVVLGAGATMSFLHADGSQHSSPNENTLVVRLDLGAKRLLLMGDAEAGGRRAPDTTPTPDSIEGLLLECCRESLRADVLVVGHHGSMTSSRRALLDAVDAEVFLVSSGPARYGSVTLPDPVVIDELSARGLVLRTDRDDLGCSVTAQKLGPDNDGKPGGCDNVRITIDGSGLTAAYHVTSD